MGENSMEEEKVKRRKGDLGFLKTQKKSPDPKFSRPWSTRDQTCLQSIDRSVDQPKAKSTVKL